MTRPGGFPKFRRPEAPADPVAVTPPAEVAPASPEIAPGRVPTPTTSRWPRPKAPPMPDPRTGSKLPPMRSPTPYRLPRPAPPLHERLAAASDEYEWVPTEVEPGRRGAVLRRKSTNSHGDGHNPPPMPPALAGLRRRRLQAENGEQAPSPAPTPAPAPLPRLSMNDAGKVALRRPTTKPKQQASASAQKPTLTADDIPF